MERRLYQKRDMGTKIAYGIVAIVSLILINIFSRFIYAQSWFGSTTLDKTVDPFDIITLIITTLVTLWLGWYVSKKITEQRYEKEYIISDLMQIEKEINNIDRSIQVNSIDLQVILEKLYRLKTDIDRCSQTIRIFKISAKIDSLNDQYYLLYQKTTDLEGSDLELEGAIRNEIDQTCNNFVIQTRKLIFDINKT